MNTLTKSLFLVAGATGVASGNAFNINEHDAKVTGKGGASAASNTDASSVIFNPGGIPVAEGTQVSIGGSLYIAEGSYEPTGGAKTSTDSAPSVVPSLYLTSRVHDMIAVGIGVHLPFGLAVSYPEGHAQRGTIQDQSLRTYFITPSIGINLHKQVPGLSIGGGIDIVPATVQLERKLVFGNVEGDAVLGGDAVGIGGRAGIMYHPPALKKLKLGVMWRSNVTLDFEGTGDFDIAQPYRDQLPPDGAISTSITLPQSIAGGFAVELAPKAQLEMNAVWINWNQFEELNITLPDGSASITPENYQNTITYRFGLEYTGLANDKASIRGGFIYDPTPIPTSTLTAQLPDIDRKNLTLGGSYKFGDYAAHLGLLWVTPGTRDTATEPYAPSFKATYGVHAFVTSLMISGTFGGKAAPSSPDPEPTTTASR